MGTARRAAHVHFGRTIAARRPQWGAKKFVVNISHPRLQVYIMEPRRAKKAEKGVFLLPRHLDI